MIRERMREQPLFVSVCCYGVHVCVLAHVCLREEVRACSLMLRVRVGAGTPLSLCACARVPSCSHTKHRRDTCSVCRDLAAHDAVAIHRMGRRLRVRRDACSGRSLVRPSQWGTLREYSRGCRLHAPLVRVAGPAARCSGILGVLTVGYSEYSQEGWHTHHRCSRESPVRPHAAETNQTRLQRHNNRRCTDADGNSLVGVHCSVSRPRGHRAIPYVLRPTSCPTFYVLGRCCTTLRVWACARWIGKSAPLVEACASRRRPLCRRRQ
jgi:hypothetical protein